MQIQIGNIWLSFIGAERLRVQPCSTRMAVQLPTHSNEAQLRNSSTSVGRTSVRAEQNSEISEANPLPSDKKVDAPRTQSYRRRSGIRAPPAPAAGEFTQGVYLVLPTVFVFLLSLLQYYRQSGILPWEERGCCSSWISSITPGCSPLCPDTQGEAHQPAASAPASPGSLLNAESWTHLRPTDPQSAYQQDAQELHELEKC